MVDSLFSLKPLCLEYEVTAGSFDRPPLQYLAHETGERIAYRLREGKSDDGPGNGAGDGPGVFWLSGFKSDMDGNKASMIDGLAARRGLAYTRFDYQGHGQSEGHFENCTISTWLEDALLIFDEVTMGPQVLVGSSMGGWLALLVALRRPERVAGVLLIAPAPDFTERMWLALSDGERDLLESGETLRRDSEYDDAPYSFSPQLFEDGRQHLLLGQEIDLDVPVRIVHGQADLDVSWELSLELAKKLGSSDVQLTFLKSGDHRLSDAAGLTAISSALEDLTNRPAEP